MLRVETDTAGDRTMTSCWRLEAAELAEVARTGRIYITVVGGVHPPIRPDAFRPFGVPES